MLRNDDLTILMAAVRHLEFMCLFRPPTKSVWWFLANVRYMLSLVRRLSSVTLVRPTQAVQIFGNISTALGTLAIQ